MKAVREDARRLLHEGALALSRVEENGIRIDASLLDRTIEKVGRRIDHLSEKLKTSKEWTEWRRMFSSKSSLGSRPQLVKVLRRMGHELSGEKTFGKRQKADKTTLERLDSPFVRDYLEVEKLKKLHGTYLLGVRREVVDGLMHPFNNLHTVISYRSSVDRPSFQNIPIRDKLIGKLIRRCFIPRDGHVLVEFDFKQLEVSVSACYHRDPRMIEYLESGYDFHRALAAELYMLDESEVGADVRYCAKNRFVFPEFYGSYFAQCAPSLWEAIDSMSLTTASGRPLKEHLAERGITALGRAKSDWESGRIETGRGTFVDHVREVEREFWSERFCVYAEWKQRWWRKYLERGWFDLLTGFRESGLYKRNDAINHPVQGAAFHCLLWTLIETAKWLARSRMRSMVVGQIHDSMLCDVHRDELDDVLARVRELATVRLREAWRWIVVPLAVDVAVAHENWFEKRELMDGVVS